MVFWSTCALNYYLARLNERTFYYVRLCVGELFRELAKPPPPSTRSIFGIVTSLARTVCVVGAVWRPRTASMNGRSILFCARHASLPGLYLMLATFGDLFVFIDFEEILHISYALLKNISIHKNIFLITHFRV